MNSAPKMQTIRQEMIHCLEQGPMTIRDLSQAVGIMEKEVCHHLPFIEKTVRAGNKTMRVEPYFCKGCGFQFKDRKKFEKPGKCPECRGTRIALATFSI